MTNGREKKYTRCQASYPHSALSPQLYDFFIAGAVSTRFDCICVWGRRGCPLRRRRALVGAKLRAFVLRTPAPVSSGAPLDVACEDTLASRHRSVGARALGFHCEQSVARAARVANAFARAAARGSLVRKRAEWRRLARSASTRARNLLALRRNTARSGAPLRRLVGRRVRVSSEGHPQQNPA
jgi:hypothetical protein